MHCLNDRIIYLKYMYVMYFVYKMCYINKFTLLYNPMQMYQDLELNYDDISHFEPI